MAVSTRRKDAVPAEGEGTDAGIRISDAATRVGVSARTLRYYEELGLLIPSLYTAGGERRYTTEDLAHLERILELRDEGGAQRRVGLQRVSEGPVALHVRVDLVPVGAQGRRQALPPLRLGPQAL